MELEARRRKMIIDHHPNAIHFRRECNANKNERERKMSIRSNLELVLEANSSAFINVQSRVKIYMKKNHEIHRGELACVRENYAILIIC